MTDTSFAVQEKSWGSYIIKDFLNHQTNDSQYINHFNVLHLHPMDTITGATVA